MSGHLNTSRLALLTDPRTTGSVRSRRKTRRFRWSRMCRAKSISGSTYLGKDQQTRTNIYEFDFIVVDREAVCSLGLQGPAVRVSPSIRERSPGAGVAFKLRRTSDKMGDGLNLILPIKLEQDVQRCHQGQLLCTP